MSIIDSLSVSVSGMTAQRQRVNTISENLANANTHHKECTKRNYLEGSTTILK